MGLFFGMPKGTPSVTLTDTTYKLSKDGTVIRVGNTNSSRYDRSTIAIKDGILFGSILLPNGTGYRVIHDQGESYTVQKIDRSKFPQEDCEDDEKDKVSRFQSPGKMLKVAAESVPGEICTSVESSKNIDVLVVYTKAAIAEAGGEQNFGLAVQATLSETNYAYTDSLVTQQISVLEPLLYAEGYVEPFSTINILNDLRNTNHSILKKVHERRDQLKADIVVLVTQKLGACGRAKTMSTVSHNAAIDAFAVVPFHCLAGSFAFAHELGHIMGARHDIDTDATTNAPYKFNHGYVQLNPTDMNVSPWLTIMATRKKCDDHNENHPSDQKKCNRIGFWSNPDKSVDYYGDSLGKPDESNNCQTLNNTAGTVANFR